MDTVEGLILGLLALFAAREHVWRNQQLRDEFRFEYYAQTNHRQAAQIQSLQHQLERAGGWVPVEAIAQ